MRTLSAAVVLGLLLAEPAVAQQRVDAPGDGVVAALVEAIRLRPDDPALHYQLSQAYAMADDPAAARTAITCALRLRPSNPAYLRSAAVLSTWVGDYAGASRYYQRLQVVEPSDVGLWFALGRVLAWSGDTDEAANALRRFVEARPEASEGWLELARVESWRGNYRAALAILADERRRIGPSSDRDRLAARIWAAAGRPRQALRILAPLLATDASGLDTLLMYAGALAAADRSVDARAALARAAVLEPGLQQTRAATRTLRAAIGSTVEPTAAVYADSDRLEIRRAGSTGTLVLADATRVSVGYEHLQLRAPAESGLGRPDGRAARRDTGWLAITRPFGVIAASVRLGAARSTGGDGLEYGAGVRLRIDAMSLALDSSRGALAISPRTIAAGLQSTRHAAQIDWTPAIDVHLRASSSVDLISDGNTRWELTLAPTVGVARREHINLDAGFTAYHLRTARDLPHGYYDPGTYESYTAALYPYWKLTENVGLGGVIGWGLQGEAARPFRPGGQVAGEATVGIYRAWMLKVGGGVTENTRLASGAYRGVSGQLTVVRRF